MCTVQLIVNITLRIVHSTPRIMHSALIVMHSILRMVSVYSAERTENCLQAH